MSVLDSIKNFLIGEEEGEDYEPLVDEEIGAETVDIAQERRNREVKINTTATVQIVLSRPTDFSEVKSIGDDLNNQKTVLLNLEQVKAEDAKRIMDFLSGVAYANGATIKMTASKTFVIMPKNVGFSGVDLMSELENNGYSFDN
ncbi:MAG: cell division protein SepF [Oscillospiraceae bacterium]|nr:cell division protein SepF [Oscillospiraceae bacterium]